jgi:hypothetical protein
MKEGTTTVLFTCQAAGKVLGVHWIGLFDIWLETDMAG